jgi:hypothetical protein
MPKNRYKYINTTLNNKPGMSPNQADLSGLRRLVALKTSESE